MITWKLLQQTDTNMFDDERFKNFLLYKIYATDEEVADIMPLMGFILVLLAVGFFLLKILGIV